jgi:membrane associated rhomboid family serine protease
MGIYDREYYRDDGTTWGGWGSRGATPWLIGITVAAWLVQLFTRDLPGGGLTVWGVYEGGRILQGEVWRLLTPTFLHDERGLLNILFNMLILYWIGTQLEERYGSREFLAFYLAAGVLSHLAFFTVQLAGAAGQAIVLGSNPAVNAAFVVYAFLYPRNKVLLFFVLPVPVWLVAAGFVTFSALGVAAGVGFAFVALAGALFGAVYYLTGLRLTGRFPSRSNRDSAPVRSQPRLRVVPSDDDDGSDTDEPVPAPPPAEERFEERVDRLLEKVSQYGQESLTPDERELLFRAGEHYKKRRR